MAKKKISIKNRKASFEYFLEMEMEAGLVLTGPEVKSLRDGKASISEAYGQIRNGEVWIRGMQINRFENAGYVEQEPLRDRKLLLNSSEIKKLSNKLKDVGYTIVPLEVFFSDSGFAKIRIALGKGKKNYDKRESLKKKDVERDLQRY
jgi:SsrA-binding protein